MAEECGLKVDDIVVRINNVDITNMSHRMVHELIIGFSDSFLVGVEREDDFSCTEIPKNDLFPINLNAYESHSDRPGSGMYSEISANSAADSITAELEASKITEEHIAEIMSGEAEVLKDHNVIGYADSFVSHNQNHISFTFTFVSIFQSEFPKNNAQSEYIQKQ